MKVTGFTSIPQQNKKQYMSQDKSQVSFGTCSRIFNVPYGELPKIEDRFQRLLNSVNPDSDMKYVRDTVANIADFIEKYLPKEPNIMEKATLDANQEKEGLKEIISLINKGLKFNNVDGKKVVFKIEDKGSESKTSSIVKSLVLDETNSQNPSIAYITRVIAGGSDSASPKMLELDALTFTKDEGSENAKGFDDVLNQLRQLKAKLAPQVQISTPSLAKPEQEISPAKIKNTGAAEMPKPLAPKPEKTYAPVNGELTNSVYKYIQYVVLGGKYKIYWLPKGSNKNANPHFIIETLPNKLKGITESKFDSLDFDLANHPVQKQYLAYLGITTNKPAADIAKA